MTTVDDFGERFGAFSEGAGGTLACDVARLAPVFARLLDGKAYRRVSAEIYDEPPAGLPVDPETGLPPTGKMLRRVAFLGGDVPEVKALGDVPPVDGDGQSVRGIALFAAGDYRGKEYTAADLADIERNFALYSTGDNPPFPVPAVVGHEEDQSWLADTGLPAAGWVSACAVSASVQTMRPFSEAANSPWAAWADRASAGSWVVFSEANQMPDMTGGAAGGQVPEEKASPRREALLDALSACGLDAALFAALDDAGLMEVLRVAEAKSGIPGGGTDGGGFDAPADAREAREMLQHAQGYLDHASAHAQVHGVGGQEMAEDSFTDINSGEAGRMSRGRERLMEEHLKAFGRAEADGHMTPEERQRHSGRAVEKHKDNLRQLRQLDGIDPPAGMAEGGLSDDERAVRALEDRAGPEEMGWQEKNPANVQDAGQYAGDPATGNLSKEQLDARRADHDMRVAGHRASFDSDRGDIDAQAAVRARRWLGPRELPPEPQEMGERCYGEEAGYEAALAYLHGAQDGQEPPAGTDAPQDAPPDDAERQDVIAGLQALIDAGEASVAEAEAALAQYDAECCPDRDIDAGLTDPQARDAGLMSEGEDDDRPETERERQEREAERRENERDPERGRKANLPHPGWMRLDEDDGHDAGQGDAERMLREAVRRSLSRVSDTKGKSAGAGVHPRAAAAAVSAHDQAVMRLNQHLRVDDPRPVSPDDPELPADDGLERQAANNRRWVARPGGYHSGDLADHAEDQRADAMPARDDQPAFLDALEAELNALVDDGELRLGEAEAIFAQAQDDGWGEDDGQDDRPTSSPEYDAVDGPPGRMSEDDPSPEEMERERAGVMGTAPGTGLARRGPDGRMLPGQGREMWEHAAADRARLQARAGTGPGYDDMAEPVRARDSALAAGGAARFPLSDRVGRGLAGTPLGRPIDARGLTGRERLEGGDQLRRLMREQQGASFDEEGHDDDRDGGHNDEARLAMEQSDRYYRAGRSWDERGETPHVRAMGRDYMRRAKAGRFTDDPAAPFDEYGDAMARRRRERAAETGADERAGAFMTRARDATRRGDHAEAERLENEAMRLSPRGVKLAEVPRGGRPARPQLLAEPRRAERAGGGRRLAPDELRDIRAALAAHAAAGGQFAEADHDDEEARPPDRQDLERQEWEDHVARGRERARADALGVPYRGTKAGLKLARQSFPGQQHRNLAEGGHAEDDHGDELPDGQPGPTQAERHRKADDALRRTIADPHDADARRDYLREHGKHNLPAYAEADQAATRPDRRTMDGGDAALPTRAGDADDADHADHGQRWRDALAVLHAGPAGERAALVARMRQRGGPLGLRAARPNPAPPQEYDEDGRYRGRDDLARVARADDRAAEAARDLSDVKGKPAGHAAPFPARAGRPESNPGRAANTADARRDDANAGARAADAYRRRAGLPPAGEEFDEDGLALYRGPAAAPAPDRPREYRDRRRGTVVDRHVLAYGHDANEARSYELLQRQRRARERAEGYAEDVPDPSKDDRERQLRGDLDIRDHAVSNTKGKGGQDHPWDVAERNSRVQRGWIAQVLADHPHRRGDRHPDGTRYTADDFAEGRRRLRPAAPPPHNRPHAEDAVSIFTRAPSRTLNRFSEEHPVNEQQLVNLVTRTATAAATAAVQKAMGGAAQQVKAEADRARAELTKFSEEKVAAEKKSAVESVVARLSGEGKLPPAEHERARKRLLRADSRTVVEKFSEGGVDKALTEFDLAVADYEARPTCFGERFASPADAPASKEGAEVAKVEAHWDAFSERFGKGGTTRDDFIGAFKAAQKLAPDLTAQRFLDCK